MKTNLNKHIALLLTFLVSLMGCKKDIEGYENDPRVYFYERTQDGFSTRVGIKTLSFLMKPAEVKEDTIKVIAKIMGLKAGYDRTFLAIPDTGSNANTTDYKILPGIIKAGEVIGYLPVVVQRTAEIKQMVKVLNVMIVDGADFKAGISDQQDVKMSLSWTDGLIKPVNWDTALKTYFGDYSTIKYQFIIDVLGRTEFPVLAYGVPFVQGVTLTPYEMQDKQAILKAALLEYNLNHSTPLSDEFGPITF